ncbi:MAG: hypothetical protein EOS03_13445 [Mesorhizobium sp.]|uniref:hypothetical protein n=1 Tax=Mesorhizobium sp. TaxID=1871066 RepID=UPI000FE76888|nr:hypothetical protein [Mesorhizobium sp.]RWN47349.1 MAG: hypothetical protein EOS03_13445 [Mesorhizobium sp.]
MARPKLGKGESERLQMVISREELDAIEDWRFRNRVQSKSEAIRRLCQIGKDMEFVVPDATERAELMLSSARLMYEFVVRSVETLDDGGKLDTANLIGRAANLLDQAADIHLILMRENNRIIPLAEPGKLQQALEEAARNEEDMAQFVDAYVANESELSESVLMKKALGELTGAERAAAIKQDTVPQAEKRAMFWMMRLAKMRVDFFRKKEDAEK